MFVNSSNNKKQKNKFLKLLNKMQKRQEIQNTIYHTFLVFMKHDENELN